MWRIYSNPDPHGAPRAEKNPPEMGRVLRGTSEVVNANRPQTYRKGTWTFPSAIIPFKRRNQKSNSAPP
jgi:hypothetical protein